MERVSVCAFACMYVHVFCVCLYVYDMKRGVCGCVRVHVFFKSFLTPVYCISSGVHVRAHPPGIVTKEERHHMFCYI